ncbi:hypothetical protein PISMIDRAFT_113598, partial [Pisolithus microcarpus 441]
YFHNVIACYLVAIESWPNHIPFMNLSTVSSALPDLETLLRMWESGSIYWKQLSNEEYKALHCEHDGKLNCSELVEHTCRSHSDKGTKQASCNNASRNSHHAFKSAKTTHTDTEDEDSNHTSATMATAQGNNVSPTATPTYNPALNAHIDANSNTSTNTAN